MNYNLLMEEEIKKVPLGEKLLLHACCAPCSSSVLERLGQIFSITIFFYNPNITEEKEYQKRLLELKKFISVFPTKYPITLLEGKYEKNKFLDIAKGLEKEKERGKRCFYCYQLRLRETAIMASTHHFPYFTTTLSLSPYKNSTWINEIGKDLEKEYKCKYLYADFKKKNGYQRSIELSKQYHLYRQNYCGCIYSKQEVESKNRNKIQENPTKERNPYIMIK